MSSVIETFLHFNLGGAVLWLMLTCKSSDTLIESVANVLMATVWFPVLCFRLLRQPYFRLLRRLKEKKVIR